ncbi:MATE family efflux transporter [Evtepia sp.]|uniref:MATE family efflux transporter n=1 Tax=Evtepia sp. TaxID=2773933 RepID=UPI002A809B89|nr:MATE family efflux transporter [Evtepia sp.]MDY3993499.1 MATE family efflux transporter [Evtepia sp.]MDY4431236.1 MATE family efflux transporter [Evtepia sp.]
MEQAVKSAPPGGNPLGTEKISRLLVQFAIPAILSSLLGAVYNLTDQVFIGQRIGYLGNAATTVAAPITVVCGAVALLFGIGATVHFNILQGKGKTREALGYGGGGISMLVISGVVLMAVTLAFTVPILYLFGANQEVLPLAKTYLRITALGIPFLLLTTGGTLLVRADGSPKYTLLCSAVGVGANIVLDFLFLYPLGMGVEGAALATILGQVLSGLMVVRYLGHMKTGPLKREDFRVKKDRVGNMVKIGSAASLNQVAMLLSQIVLNSSLRHYGDLSVYGSSEVLAAAGVVAKVNMIFYSVIIGFSIGCEPIMGFNYGAKNFARVRETYRKTLLFVVVIGAVEFLCFWLFPNQLLSIFGEGTTAYGAFALRYMHIFMFMVAINGVAPVTMNMLSSTGNAKRGTIISLTRQIFLFIPLLLILPLFLNLDGVLYAGPTADFLAMVIALLVVRPELKKMKEAGT